MGEPVQNPPPVTNPQSPPPSDPAPPNANTSEPNPPEVAAPNSGSAAAPGDTANPPAGAPDGNATDAAGDAAPSSPDVAREWLEPWLDWLPAWAQDNQYVGAGVVIVGAFVAAVFFRWLTNAIVGRWAQRTANKHDDQLLEIFRRPIFVTVILVGLALATMLLDLGPLPEKVTLSLLKTIAIFLWIVFAIRFTKFVLTILSHYNDRFPLVQDRTLPLFQNLAALSFFGIGAYFLFLAWDIDVTAWLASAGIIGLAVSFAAKDTLSNLFAGVFILADAPYAVGDFIVLDSGERGCVTQIGLRSTRLLTRDDVEVTVPNSVMGSSKIVNETAGPHQKYRIRISVGVAYGSDIDRVKEILLQIGVDHPDACKDPEPRVRFRGFGDSSLDLELLCWVQEPVLRGRVLDALNTAVYKRFVEEAVEIPFPQRDVHMKSGS